MAKQCVVNRNSEGDITSVLVQNPDFVKQDLEKNNYKILTTQLKKSGLVNNVKLFTAKQLSNYYSDMGLNGLQAIVVSSKVNGLYNSKTKEIIIRKRDYSNDQTRTLIHEWGHAFLQVLRDNNFELYNNTMIVLKSEASKDYKIEKYYKNVSRDYKKEGDSDNYIIDEEVLVRVLEDSYMSKNNEFNKLLNQIKDFFKSLIGITSYSSDDILKMNIQEVADAILSDMMSGKIPSVNNNLIQKFSVIESDKTMEYTIGDIVEYGGVKYYITNINSDTFKGIKVEEFSETYSWEDTIENLKEQNFSNIFELGDKIYYTENDSDIAIFNNNRYIDDISTIKYSFDTSSELIQRAIERNGGKSLDKAPNGEDSILYQSFMDQGFSDQEAQEKVAQVYTDNFGSWFGRWWESPEESSRVVDANGQPRIVWQGTNQQTIDNNLDGARFQGYRIWGNEYNKFEQDGEEKNYRFSNTAFFLEDYHSAGIYARGGFDIRTIPEKYRENVPINILTPVFLNVRKQKNTPVNSNEIIPQIDQSLSEGYDAFYGENRDPSMGKTWSVADSHQIREISETGSILFQNETQDKNLKPVPQEILKEITDTLMLKGLVKEIKMLNSESLEKLKLENPNFKNIGDFNGAYDSSTKTIYIVQKYKSPQQILSEMINQNLIFKKC